jgi:hypothetical protein
VVEDGLHRAGFGEVGEHYAAAAAGEARMDSTRKQTVAFTHDSKVLEFGVRAAGSADAPGPGATLDAGGRVALSWRLHNANAVRLMRVTPGEGGEGFEDVQVLYTTRQDEQLPGELVLEGLAPGTYRLHSGLVWTAENWCVPELAREVLLAAPPAVASGGSTLLADQGAPLRECEPVALSWQVDGYQEGAPVSLRIDPDPGDGALHDLTAGTDGSGCGSTSIVLARAGTYELTLGAGSGESAWTLWPLSLEILPATLPPPGVLDGPAPAPEGDAAAAPSGAAAAEEAPAIAEFRGSQAEPDGLDHPPDSLELVEGASVVLAWKIEGGDCVELACEGRGAPRIIDCADGSGTCTVQPSAAVNDYWLTALRDGARSKPSLVHVSTHAAGEVVSVHALVAPEAAAGGTPRAGSVVSAAVLWQRLEDSLNQSFFFRGPRYVRYNNGYPDPAKFGAEGTDAGYPKSISEGWPDLWPEGIDAALNWNDGSIYFFRGDECVRWVVGADERDPGDPLRIGSVFKGLTGPIDAAVLWNDGNAYFFKGSRYLTVKVSTRSVVGGTRPISGPEDWPGLWADGVDAAFVWANGAAYFFKDERYLKWVMGSGRAEAPRPIDGNWSGLVPAAYGHLDVAPAVARFKQVAGDEQVYRKGQFAFAGKLEAALEDRFARVLAKDPALASDLKKPPPTDLVHFALRACRGDPRGLASLTQRIHDVLDRHPGSPAAAELNDALGGRLEDGAALYDRVAARFRGGTSFAVGSPAYAAAFGDPAVLKLQVLAGLRTRSRDRCFAFANDSISFLDSKGGLKGWKEANPHFSAAVYSGLKTTPRDASDPAFGQLVAYAAQLPDAVAGARRALDLGYVVRVGVLSGLLADHGVAEPDHYILLIGWEGDDFAFWDPDSFHTNSVEPSFGRLKFVPGPAATAGSAFGDFYRNGRLTTAGQEGDLQCVDGKGGNYKLTVDAARGVVIEEHRYQPTVLQGL